MKTILSFFIASLLCFSCAKEYSIDSNGKTVSSGNWEFKDSSKEYMGFIDSAYISEIVNTKQLNITGKSNNGSESWSLRLYADTFVVGSYKASLFQASMSYTGASKKIYDVNQLSGDFTVLITAIAGNFITGTFSGSARDSLNNLKNIFNGKFKSTFKTPIREPEAVGVLGSTAGNCSDLIINGIYKQGISVVAGNTVELKVTVATPGTYNISTNSVNGISFSKQGTFTAAGVQNVILNATGTPMLPGDQEFILKFGNSQCGFKLNFLQGVSASNDYYPLSEKTNWTYSDLVKTVKNIVTGQKKTIDGSEYNIITSFSPPTAPTSDTLLIRKTGGDYFSYMNHASLLNLDEPVFSENIILKDNVPVGNAWTSQILKGKLAGFPVGFYFKYTIIAKGVAENVGGFQFTDIIKVKQEVLINSSIVSTVETWYAKNVGPVRMIVRDKNFLITGYQIF